MGSFLFMSLFRDQLVEACFGFYGFSTTLFEVNFDCFSFLFFVVPILQTCKVLESICLMKLCMKLPKSFSCIFPTRLGLPTL